MVNNVHDALFKATFSQVEHAAGELQQMLPPRLARLVDFKTLALCPGSFVDEVFKERHTDLLFSVFIAGCKVFVYVLFEHQSTVDLLMPFRLLRYMVRVWEQFLAEHPDAKKLPAILPVVLHHSETGWTAATSFEGLFELDAETLAEVGPYLPRFRFLLDDISDESDEALQARAMSALGRLVLWCLRNARTPEQLVAGIGGWLDLIRQVRQAPNGVAALSMIWRYIFAVNKRYKREDLVAMLTEAVGKEENEELLSVADQLIEQGRQEGQRKMLLKQLATRFGALPATAVAQVNAAGPAQLERWFDRVLTAETLVEVLGDG